MRVRAVLFIGFLLGLTQAGLPAPLPRYTIQAVPIDGGVLNNRGWVAGAIPVKRYWKSSFGHVLPERHLALWQSGLVRDLGLLSHNHEVSATAMNDRGEIVGVGGGENGASPDLFLWNGHQMICLRKAAQGTQWVNAINNPGEVVGTVTVRGVQKGFVYRDGHLREVDDPLQGTMCTITGINDDGDMVGLAADPHTKGWEGKPVVRLIEWSHGKAHVIPTPADFELGPYINPMINRRGDIVFVGGQISDPRREHAYVCHSGKLAEVGPVSGYPLIEIYGINDNGDVVGGCGRPNDLISGKAAPAAAIQQGPLFLWANGKVTPLKNLAAMNGDIVQLYGINNHGQIIGEGRLHGKREMFLMTPVAATTK
jgi:uncharacterized membrane protein